MKTRDIKGMEGNLIMLFLYRILLSKSASKLIKIFKIEGLKNMTSIVKLLTLFLGFIICNPIYSQSKEDFFGKLRTVVIDAGHGGKDPGSLGKKSREKNIALAVSLKLGVYLEENYPDLNVLYTRKTDVFVELKDRANIANKAKADLFICIHANSGNSAAYGTETYVMGNAKTDANLRAAQRENSVILLEDNYEEKYQNFDPYNPVSYIIFTMGQAAYQTQSIAFAEKIQAQFRDRVGRKDRGVKMEHFLVLHQTTMPSVLVETGFISNLEEEKFLMSTKGQDYLASAVYRAFREYKEEIENKSKLMLDESVNEELKKEKRPVIEVVKESSKNGNKNDVVDLKSEELKKLIEEKLKGPKGEMNSKLGIVFKVQIATSKKKLPLKPENFKGLKEVEMYEYGVSYGYTYGNEPNWESAGILQQKAKDNGFIDAFVVAFNNGKRIAVGEAVKLLKKDN